MTHTLVASAAGNEAAVPLLVREIPGSDRIDAISPYSYPGASVRGGPVDRDAVDLAGSGLVSAFVRDRLGEPVAFTGATERSIVLVSDPALPRKSRMSDRQQIRKNEAAGYELSSLPGPRSPARPWPVSSPSTRRRCASSTPPTTTTSTPTTSAPCSPRR